MIESASGVLDAAPKTAARPTPAPSSIGRPSTRASTLPSVAPTKKSGVTSPPRKPAAQRDRREDELRANANQGRFGSVNERTIIGTPSPR